MVKILNKKRNVLLIIFAILAGVLVFNKSFFGLIHNTFKIKELNKEITALDAEYNELQNEYGKILSGDQSYLEQEARVSYNMAREGEIEFRIKK